MSRTAKITLTVDLDKDRVPTRLAWQASDATDPEPTPCQLAMLSFWDGDSKTTAAIDLWTREMTVEDMNRHVYQVIHKLADTYGRATQDQEAATVIHQFGEEFAKNRGLLSEANP